MIAGIGAIAPALLGAGTSPSPSASTSAATGGGVSFASMLADTAGQTVERLKDAEKLSLDALQGKADMRQVVDAVMSAEQSFQAAVAIRDKIVSAYLEVSRMAI